MSIKILRLGTTGIKDILGSYLREHGSEIAIVGVMTAVIVGITAFTTGDIMQAIARTRGR
ncbi:MAG TPA: hypothetical protein VH415_00540 [Nitrososphaeraceae archaeon]|jgi:hypothetical protein